MCCLILFSLHLKGPFWTLTLELWENSTARLHELQSLSLARPELVVHCPQSVLQKPGLVTEQISLKYGMWTELQKKKPLVLPSPSLACLQRWMRESDFHAASSKASRDSTLSTWLSFHDAWYGPETSPWPLTVEKLLVISAMFKKGTYKSFTNYLARAKEEHIVGGFEWTQVHDRVAKNCSRSVKRGLSGARRSDALDFDRAMVLCNKVGMNYTKPRAVFCPSALMALGVWFLCREIEIAGALANELEVDIIDMTVHFTFPVSKSDSEASGIRRSLGCLCAVTNHCPAHIAKTYLGALRRHFVTKLKMQWDTLPLFPTADGTAMSKDSVVRFLVSLVKDYGGRVVDEVSRPCISGHAFRISGARLLAKLGLDVISISLHGRWSSSAVLRYIADTPLESLSQRLVSNKPQALKNRVSELELGTLHARDESESASDSEDST